MSLYKTIGLNLTALREKRGLSQDEAAVYLGVSRPLISYYENAEREIPLPQLEKLADLFGVEVADLMADPSSLDQQTNIAFAFRTEGLDHSDIKSIAELQKIVKNYVRMKSIANEADESR